MTAARYILALDQGTSSSRATLFDRSGRPVASAQRELSVAYPMDGHVVQDPEEIWDGQLSSAREALGRAGVSAAQVVAIGIANQRETTIVWDRTTGRPVGPAIVWQSRVTAPRCAALRDAGHEPLFRERTGLPIDPYFSAPKIAELLDAQPGLRDRAAAGELAFGTVDTFLLWRLTGGRVHATDVSNASRTLLFDIHRLAWDPELADVIGVPDAMLPEVRPSSGLFGETDPAWLGASVPVTGIAGDQQAATFGQACLRAGQAKSTYGTGAFVLVHTGDRPVRSDHGLLTTILWQLGESGTVAYALEGSVFVAGAAIQWLRDELRAIAAAGDVEGLAATAGTSSEVVLVPAFVGLGAPHWDPTARGLLIGITRATGLAEIARAAVESIAYQVRDVVDAIEADAGDRLNSLRVDGGAARNDTLLQLQADLLDVPVERPAVTETTSLGAAFLAGIAVDFWSGPDEIATIWQLDRRFEPAMERAERERLMSRWRRAVQRAKGWTTQ